MIALGTEAPDFSLEDYNGRVYSLKDFRESKALLVVFMCNHCPYVKHIQQYFTELAEEYQQKGVALVGINANDPVTYPEDNRENMKLEAERLNYTFPYLVDDAQTVAQTYRAACTPDFFLFDADRKLVYRGQMDDSRPGNDVPLTGADLKKAMDAVLAGLPVQTEQKPSIGCNIKWKPGNEPDYFG
jgi:peroxiredoxin